MKKREPDDNLHVVLLLNDIQPFYTLKLSGLMLLTDQYHRRTQDKPQQWGPRLRRAK